MNWLRDFCSSRPHLRAAVILDSAEVHKQLHANDPGVWIRTLIRESEPLPDGWITAYHGTSAYNVEAIASFGLKTGPSAKSKDGIEMYGVYCHKHGSMAKVRWLVELSSCAMAQMLSKPFRGCVSA